MLVSIFIASCDYFNRPMLDYLEEWTNTAQVSKHTFDGTYPVTAGLPNVPSGEDRVITYYIINPQNYVLDSTVTFAHDETLVVDNNTPSDFAVVEQDLQDKNIIRLTLNNSVGATGILPLDGDGTEITPTITIREPNSGRFFGSYTVPVRVNSLPPRLFNAVIMKYRDSNEKYAVCFSLPAMGAGDIHRDITQITVNGTFNGQPFNKTYRVTGGGTGTISVEGLETSSISDYEVIGSEFVDMGTTFVGIKTGLDLGPTTPTCTITLTDSSGATTVTAVSTVSTLLNKIYVNENSGDDNNTGTVSSPVKTIGNALEKLRDVPKGNVILQSDISLTGEVTVGSGISVTVTSDGSGRTVTNGAGRVFNITSGGSLTLGENITLTGTNDTGNGGAVYVNGGTFTMEADSKITGSSAQNGGGVYIDSGTFTMSDTATIQDNTATTHGGGVHIFSGGTFTMNSGTIGGDNANTAKFGGGVFVSGGTFNMNDGTISGNTVTKSGGGVFVNAGNFTMKGGTIGGSEAGSANSAQYGGGVYVFDGTFTVSGSSLTITGNTAHNVYLASGKTISIGDGGLTGGTIGVTAADMKAGGAVQITDIDVPGAADRFTSDISSYSIEETIATTDGGIAVFLSDAEVSYQKSSALARSLGALSDAVSEANTWNDGGTITLMKDIDGNNAVFSTGPITFSGGTGASPIILNLNGKTINRGLETATSDGMVIKISGGALTIQDSSSGGKITGGYTNRDLTGSGIHIDSGSVIMTGGEISGNGKDSSLKGGGVFIKNGGSFRMQGGSIADNRASNGGGVYLNGGTFTITGGSINGNKANNDGGGVYMNSGTFTINGGSINGNTAGQNGGGVYLLGGKVTIDSHGGSINGNTASQNGGGIYFSGGDFIIGKERKEDASQNDYILFEIKNNDGSGIENNLYVKDGAPLIQVYTQLGRFNNDGSVRDGEQSIGISMETKGNFAIKKADPNDGWPYWDIVQHFFFSDLDKDNEWVPNFTYPYWQL